MRARRIAKKKTAKVALSSRRGTPAKKRVPGNVARGRKMLQDFQKLSRIPIKKMTPPQLRKMQRFLSSTIDYYRIVKETAYGRLTAQQRALIDALEYDYKAKLGNINELLDKKFR